MDSAEVMLARLDERMCSMETLIGNIANTMNELSHSNVRMSVIESEMLTLKSSNEKLWQRIERAETNVSDNGWKIVAKVIEWAALILIGYVISKFKG